MFRVVIITHNQKKPLEKSDALMVTEKLYEILGRHCHKYGPGVVIEITHGAHEWEFSKKIDGVLERVVISYAKVAQNSKSVRSSPLSGSSFQRTIPPTVTVPLPPPLPPEPDEARIAVMAAKGFLEDDVYATYYRR
jgi:hypothetical protein